MFRDNHYPQLYSAVPSVLVLAYSSNVFLALTSTAEAVEVAVCCTASVSSASRSIFSPRPVNAVVTSRSPDSNPSTLDLVHVRKLQETNRR